MCIIRPKKSVSLSYFNTCFMQLYLINRAKSAILTIFLPLCTTRQKRYDSPSYYNTCFMQNINNLSPFMYYKTKKYASLSYLNTCFMQNINNLPLFMYYKSKKSASLGYFNKCFMHNIAGVSDKPMIRFIISVLHRCIIQTSSTKRTWANRD